MRIWDTDPKKYKLQTANWGGAGGGGECRLRVKCILQTTEVLSLYVVDKFSFVHGTFFKILFLMYQAM